VTTSDLVNVSDSPRPSPRLRASFELPAVGQLPITVSTGTESTSPIYVIQVDKPWRGTPPPSAAAPARRLPRPVARRPAAVPGSAPPCPRESAGQAVA